jgi:hypothetical protein
MEWEDPDKDCYTLTKNVRQFFSNFERLDQMSTINLELNTSGILFSWKAPYISRIACIAALNF